MHARILFAGYVQSVSMHKCVLDKSRMHLYTNNVCMILAERNIICMTIYVYRLTVQFTPHKQ